MREYRASHPRCCQHVQCDRRIGPIVDNTERPTSCTTLDGCRHRRGSPFQSQTIVINHHIKLIQENVLYLYQLYVRYNINLKRRFMPPQATPLDLSCLSRCPDVSPVSTSAHPQASHDGHRPARCPSPFLCQHGLACRPEKNSPQGGQVHYTVGAAGHQLTAGDLELCRFK